MTIVELESSEALVKSHDFKQMMVFIMPFLAYYFMKFMITFVIFDRLKIFDKPPEFGLTSWNLVVSLLFILFLSYQYVSLHLLIKRFKYYTWYPALICYILGHALVGVKLICIKQIKIQQENDPESSINPTLELIKTIGNDGSVALNWLFSFLLVPGLFNFKYYLVCTFFVMQGVTVFTTFYYI